MTEERHSRRRLRLGRAGPHSPTTASCRRGWATPAAASRTQPIGRNGPRGEKRRQRQGVGLATYVVEKGKPLVVLVK